MKDLEISKELLSEVLKLEVASHSLLNKLNNSFDITYMPLEDNPYTRSMTISINDFFFMCKEWAWNLDAFKYGIGSRKCFNGKYKAFIGIDNGENEWYSDSEQQAVFDACEYILKEINENR